MKVQCSRYHDFSAGHRVYGHEGKCRFLHGHNYRVHFFMEGGEEHKDPDEVFNPDKIELDSVGRVIDFSIIKKLFCNWLEENWDHRFLVWEEDPLHSHLLAIDSSVVVVPFNPTAENMAHYLLTDIGNEFIKPGEGVFLRKVVVEETRKCSAQCEKEVL